jgi:hypothetical protein
MTAPSPRVAPWMLCLTVGFMSGMCLVIGYNIHICGGILNGAVWTLALAAFMWVLPPSYIGALLLGMGAIAGLVRQASRLAAIGSRIELAAFVMPVLCLMGGKVFGWAVAAQGVCQLGKWH